jgi:hypothetical protein
MGYVYKNVDDLQDHELVGNAECVDLIKKLAPGLKGLSTSAWKEGATVVGSLAMEPGTAIATFESGRFPQRRHGQHAAFFVKREADAIWIMDQWRNDPRKPRISMRRVPRKGKRKDGSFTDPSNNADAFSVIER